MAGRPTGFKPEYVEQVEKLCLLGATDPDIADFFEVSVWTINHWKHKHPEFAERMKAGKDVADERVVRSLYHKAVGYTYEAEKVVVADGEIHKVSYKEHVPPDTTACIFWTKNRRPHEWRDVHKIEHGKPGDFSAMTDDELNAFIANGQRTISEGDSGEKAAAGKGKSVPSRRLN